MGGGGPKNTTTTVKNEPPAWLEPYAKKFLSSGWNLAQQPYEAYPGQNVAALNPLQQAGLYGTAIRGQQGSAYNTAAGNQLQSTLGGDYFNPNAAWYNQLQTEIGGNQNNPFLAEQIRLAQTELTPGIGYMGKSSGAFGNSGLAEAAARQYGDVATTMRGQAYDAERNRQMQAIAMGQQGYEGERNRQMQAMQFAPTLAAEDYKDLQMLLGAGDAYRSYEQQLLDDQRGRWDEAKQWPYLQLDWFGNLLQGAGYGSGAYGNSTTTAPNPYQSNALANFIGGGMALGGLYDILSGMS